MTSPIMSWHVTEGSPEPLGAAADEGGVNFAVFSAHADAIAVCLFDAADQEVARLRLPGRTGDVFHGHVAGLQPGARYGLRAFGAWDPLHGHRFNSSKLLVDPFTLALDRPFHLHPDLSDGPAPKPVDTAPLVPKALVQMPAAQMAARSTAVSRFDWSRQVIYELHVRGFTARHPAVPPEQRGTYAGLAHPAVIGYLRDLGVTTVELMPSAAWIDERHLPPLGLSNYWGYNPVAFLAPDPRLAPTGWAEIRTAVAALQDAGMRVVLDVVLNHSGETDHLGPTLSLRGLDNATYYRTERDRFVNHTGCGNTLALDRPPVLHLAMAAFRTWAERAGLDGFRLDLATTLGRRAEGADGAAGYDLAAPLLSAMQQDPVLCGRAIIAEPWDIGSQGYRLGSFPAPWGEWNDRFRDTVRRFWRGDSAMLGDLATRLAGSADLFASRHRPLSRSVNFVTAHDGFTLADLVAYATKHNEANGEANRDGTNDNNSWNNGVEGATDDPAIHDARLRDIRALLATLLFARGTPMLWMGDEAARSQGGNNNAYAQDGPLSWFDWEGMDRTLAAFTARLIRLRLDHPVLRCERPLTGDPVDDSLIPDVVWHRSDGAAMRGEDWGDPANRTMVVALYAEGERAIVALHADDAALPASLPEPRHGRRWICAADSADPGRGGPADDPFPLAPRSIVLLIEAAGGAPRRRSGIDRNRLDRLAGMAGIAPVWWDIDGGEHRVSDETKQALLAAMRLPAGTPGDLADSLVRVTARYRRLLPQVRVLLEGAPVAVPLQGIAQRGWLAVQREDGGLDRLAVPAGAQEVTLPALPVGRHRLVWQDDPETAGQIIVVPPRCYLPAELAGGQPRFGLAAQLYTLPRAGDQGIGDFTTLARLVATAAECGAAVVGLNPVHALFPGDRDRASPYYPSDRRFLDPIYIDIGRTGIGPMDVTGIEVPPGDPARPDALRLDAPRMDVLRMDAGGGVARAVGTLVDYPRVWAAKQAVLRDRYAATAEADAGFKAFLVAGGEALQAFATFEAIAEDLGSHYWQQWPDALRHPANPGVASFAAAHHDAIRFSSWLQYEADRQFAAALQSAPLSVGLYRDLAVGSAPDGAEAWSRQDAMLAGVSVGAPPDPFSAQGQVWGLPAPDPLAMAAEAYGGFSDLLGANMRHAGALRIDHVMALQRLFLVPEGAAAKDGAYLGYPFRDLLGVLALASQRAGCLVVGEALGTVPEGMPEALDAANVLSYSVLWFERTATGQLRRPADWRAQAAACVSTHDLPTLAGWWQGADIDERHALGLIGDVVAATAHAQRQSEKTELLAHLAEAGLLDAEIDTATPLTPALVAAVHGFIAATPAVLALVQADDLTGEITAVNLPGTDRERPNWRRRLAVGVEDLCRTDLARLILTAMRRRGARLPPA